MYVGVQYNVSPQSLRDTSLRPIKQWHGATTQQWPRWNKTNNNKNVRWNNEKNAKHKKKERRKTKHLSKLYFVFKGQRLHDNKLLNSRKMKRMHACNVRVRRMALNSFSTMCLQWRSLLLIPKHILIHCTFCKRRRGHVAEERRLIQSRLQLAVRKWAAATTTTATKKSGHSEKHVMIERAKKKRWLLPTGQLFDSFLLVSAVNLMISCFLSLLLMSMVVLMFELSLEWKYLLSYQDFVTRADLPSRKTHFQLVEFSFHYQTKIMEQ